MGHETDLPMPYAPLTHLPLFDSALPARFALVVAGVIGIVLAFAVDRLLTVRPAPGPRAAVVGAFALALVPVVPTPLLVTTRSPEPAFIASGTWKNYVSDGGVISSLPFANNGSADAQRWQAYTMARGGEHFRIPDGYFLGPGGENGVGQIGAPWRHTDWLLLRASRYGYVDEIDDLDRERARQDFDYWGIEAVFLANQITGADGPDFRAAVEITARELLGEPERVDDVLVWRIRPGVDPVTSGGD
jgi:phage tail protein X